MTGYAPAIKYHSKHEKLRNEFTIRPVLNSYLLILSPLFINVLGFRGFTRIITVTHPTHLYHYIYDSLSALSRLFSLMYSSDLVYLSRLVTPHDSLPAS